MQELDDAHLLQGLVRGEAACFDVLYARLRAPLYAFLVRLSGRRDVAEELLQETWLRLARHVTRIPLGTELRPWLFTVARNLYRSHRRWALLDAGRLRELGLLPAPAPRSPFDAAAANEHERRLEGAIAELPLRDREVVLLCSTSGFEPTEAAAVLGIRPEAVRQRLARARAKLRARLTEDETEDR